MSNRDLLRQFADGTPLGADTLQRLMNEGYLGDIGEGRLMLTTAGRILLGQTLLTPGDSASCPDDDSYLPPKQVRTGQWQELTAEQLGHRVAQDNLNQQMRQHVKATLVQPGRTFGDALDKQDMVNHPPHYKQGDIECIDAIKAALTEEEYRGYCKGNALKYIWRERHKGGSESLAKAGWYLDRMAK